MSLCLQPECLTINPANYKFCHKCGKKLLLGERYRAFKKIGEGGFGVTFSAIDEHRWDTPCVIKQFIPLQAGSNALNKCIELFKQESKLLKELGKHPQIPDLCAFFEQETKLYLIQEFIDGQDLLQELQKKGKYSDIEVKDFLLSLLGVIDFIHQQKIYHRDIKLENIIRRQDGVLMLIDFGISKQTTETIATKMGTIAGTPGYAPPEQMRGLIHPTSDLYSLAVTGIKMLTGCLAEEKNGSTVDELFDIFDMQWVWQEWLKKKGLSVNQDLALILEKMLSQKVSDRLQSAQEVINALNPPASIPKTSPAKTVKASQTPNNQIKLKTFAFETVKVNAKGDIINRETKSAEYITFDLGKGITLDMVKIPGGTFIMGSPQGEGNDSEKPQHQVTINPFFMGKYQVTQAQWEAVMGTNPSYFKVPPNLLINLIKGGLRVNLIKGGLRGNRPVERVSWDDCVEFCNKLTKIVEEKQKGVIREGGKGFRLPSEAEWEYACRAGTGTPFYYGETITTDLVNYKGNYPYGSAPKGIYRQVTMTVGSFAPNAFGLYDMHGNVWEWCEDDYAANYQNTPRDGTSYINKNSNIKVLRGGSWSYGSNLCRCAYRGKNTHVVISHYISFRIILTFSSIT